MDNHTNVVPPDFDCQPVLQNEQVLLYPLEEKDFESLYRVASDPSIWTQHPAHDRWQKEVFRGFFDEAIQSRGALAIVDKATGNLIGSTRMYGYNQGEKSILIGYTFYARVYWGTGTNHQVKKLMLDYLFGYVSNVYFHIGAANIRSQLSILRLGATRVVEQEETVASKKFVYVLSKEGWQTKRI